ncbi:MAG: aspartate/glutamate racemase family protein [Suipraeoptans sp.]
MKKKLGVIGGMGPEATSYYYEQMIAHTEVKSDQEHVDMVILSHATMPDRTKAIESGDDKEILKELTGDAKTLESLGVSNIAIPCNTSHYYYDKIQEAIDVPVIHMVRETVKYAINNYEDVKRIGIMGTDGTIDARVYHKECDALGVIPIALSKARQADIMSLIYDDIKQGKSGDQRKFDRAFEELVAKECDVIILACTELSVYKKCHDVSSRCLDAMDVLIRESVIRSGAVYK